MALSLIYPLNQGLELRRRAFVAGLQGFCRVQRGIRRAQQGFLTCRGAEYARHGPKSSLSRRLGMHGNIGNQMPRTPSPHQLHSHITSRLQRTSGGQILTQLPWSGLCESFGAALGPASSQMHRLVNAPAKSAKNRASERSLTEFRNFPPGGRPGGARTFACDLEAETYFLLCPI